MRVRHFLRGLLMGTGAFFATMAFWLSEWGNTPGQLPVVRAVQASLALLAASILLSDIVVRTASRLWQAQLCRHYRFLADQRRTAGEVLDPQSATVVHYWLQSQQ